MNEELETTFIVYQTLWILANLLLIFLCVYNLQPC